MIRNRTAQLIFQTVYCTLGAIGCVACLGIFDCRIRWDFYVHFTNQSNFLCLGVMLAALIRTAGRKEDGYVTTAPFWKFTGMLGILLTFTVFHILLADADGRDPRRNWQIGSVCFHVVLPVLYVADWFLFYERGKTKWFYPLAAAAFPLAYMVFIFLHAAVMNFDRSILIPGSETPLIYPYFFVDPAKQGIGGVAGWMVMLYAAFTVAGFGFRLLDRLGKRRPETA